MYNFGYIMRFHLASLPWTESDQNPISRIYIKNDNNKGMMNNIKVKMGF